MSHVALLGAVALNIVSPVAAWVGVQERYRLAPATSSLIGHAYAGVASKLNYDAKAEAWQFNATGKAAAKKATDPVSQLKSQVGGAGKQDKSLYSATLPTSSNKGVTYTENVTQLSFSMTPTFGLMDARAKNGQVVYPREGGGQLVYTVKSNGLKEDLVLDHATGDELTLNYQLKLPDTLEARLSKDGSVGIYSADPALFGAITYGADTDRAKIESARQHADKNHLLFALPAPVIKQSTAPGKPARAAGRAVFALDGTRLEVRATGLSQLSYPITIDPSVIITSSADFAAGNNEGGIDYPAGQINRGALTGGSTTGGYTATNSMMTGRNGHVTVAYNGYMYIMGGYGTSYLSDVQFAPINANGTVGAWHYTHNSLDDGTTYVSGMVTPISNTAAVAYNGYIYVVGGYNGGASNGVQYAQLNQNGTVGTWGYTYNSSNTGTTLTGGFTVGHYNHASLAYNGYIYVLGGTDGTNVLNDVQYAPINGNGTLGAWHYTHISLDDGTTYVAGFPVTRHKHTAVVYNGYMYVMGGYFTGSTDQNDVEFAPINANGTVGIWAATTSMPIAREQSLSLVFNGYMYIVGGSNGTVNLGDVQYAPIQANGTIGTWVATASLPSIRSGLAGVAVNGYVYSTGGISATRLPDVVSAKIDPPGLTQAYTTSANSPALARAWGSSVAYNGYLYLLGGCSAVSADVCSTPVTTVSYAPINADGTLGTWADATNALPAARGMGAAVAYEGRLYYIAGRPTSTTISPTVYYTTISATTGNTTAAWTAVAAPTGLTGTYGHAAAIYNGNLYIIGGCTTASGVCAAYQNSVQSAVLAPAGGFATNPSCANNFCPLTTFATPRWGLAAVVSGNILYINGGTHATSDTLCNSAASTNCSDVQYATISATGTLSAWTATTSAPAAAYGQAFYQSAGFLYVSSGKTATATFLNTVSYAKLTTSGALAADAGCGTAWCSTQAVTVAMGGSAYAVYNGSLYVVGGQTATKAVTAAVYLAGINNGGTGKTPSWTATTSFTTARYSHTSVAYNGYLYVIGGNNGASSLNDVQYAPINANGTIGTWTATTSFTTARYYHTSVAYNGYLYVMDGQNGTYLNDVQYAPINANGTIGTWTATTSFANARYGHTSIAYNGYLYVIGGWNGTVDLNDVQYAPINANGTIGAWTATTSFTTARDSHTSVVYNGYLYVIGGSGTAFLNDVQYAPLNVVPRIGKYSKLVNLGATYNLSSFAYNGTLPGGLGAITYKTADGTGVFGASQLASSLVASGSTCSAGTVQYVLLSLGLDDSGAGVFPDSGGGANVTDITVNYGTPHPAPNIRLYSGKSFQNEILQPYDVCGP